MSFEVTSLWQDQSSCTKSPETQWTTAPRQNAPARSTSRVNLTSYPKVRLNSVRSRGVELTGVHPPKRLIGGNYKTSVCKSPVHLVVPPPSHWTPTPPMWSPLRPACSACLRPRSRPVPRAIQQQHAPCEYLIPFWLKGVIIACHVFIVMFLNHLLHLLPVLLGLQVLRKDLGGPEVFLADRAGGHGCSAGELSREEETPDHCGLFRCYKKHWNTFSTQHLRLHGIALVYKVSGFTLCSSVWRWSVMLQVKWVWQVGHQSFESSLFTLQKTHTSVTIIIAWIIYSF